jgi:hypothetical protein
MSRQPVGLLGMTTTNRQPIRIGFTEHFVRRFFDLLLLTAVVAASAALIWKQGSFEGDIEVAAPGIDPNTIVQTVSPVSE